MQKNVCNSCIIPIPLLQPYSYISLYFFYLFLEPFKLSIGIDFLSNI